MGWKKLNTITPENNIVTFVSEYIGNFALKNSKIKPTAKYLCFTAVEDLELGFGEYQTMSRKPQLQYSIDDMDAWEDYTLNTAVALSAGQKCYWRGLTTTLNSTTEYLYFDSTGKVEASGEVDSLINWASLSSGCYRYLFKGCSELLTAPELPSTELANYCYDHMFQGCTNLILPPELPATVMKNDCYYGMFFRCYGLTKAPALPSTQLATWCYRDMFNGCESLVEAPELPATTLKAYCYYGMFAGCESLVTPPELPATTLDQYCYGQMFSACKSLATAPALPATVLKRDCYDGMFQSCYALTESPALPATTLADFCYMYMFSGCKNLVKIPRLNAVTLPHCCYAEMFNLCAKIKFSDVQTDEYKYAFRIPYEGMGEDVDDSALNSMFAGTSGTVKGTPLINTTYYTSNEII